MIETMPLEEAQIAYDRMLSGAAKFRVVLTMKDNPMRLNADLDQPVTVHAGTLHWVPSPAAGVERKMLYREGDEVARATSLVRYAPESAFPAHVHSGGEEILVLEGTFQDEHGDYPAGTYFRNPPGTSHRPAAADGCVIFVRLWQYREGDDAQIVRRPGEGEEAPQRDGATGARLLFDDGAERVTIEDWAPGSAISVPNPRGLEILVLAGSLATAGETLVAESWRRLPAGPALEAAVGTEGAKVWIKDAPMQHADVLRMPG
jgi:quercetin dioxygenase-like cupin family protein